MKAANGTARKSIAFTEIEANSVEFAVHVPAGKWSQYPS
jgi:hypothetical protein